MTLPENSVLAHWNSLKPKEAAREILPCCGSRAWAAGLASLRPYENPEALLESSDQVWKKLEDKDWLEAFMSHPRIGQRHARKATRKSLEWSSEEQSAAMQDGDSLKAALAEANRRYEMRFGRIFIVCAADKSSAEIFSILNARMNNNPIVEWRETGEQQRQITQLRLRRWLGVE